MGETLSVSYTYDNFDIDFKTNTHTVEKSSTTLTHMTSGTLTYLEHGVSADDLRCSHELWQTSPLNPELDDKSLPRPRTYIDILRLHPEADHPTGPTRRERFLAWVFIRDLCAHGPPYFAQFTQDIGLPEFVDKVPVVKMRHAPAKAMDINQSKVSGNIQAVSNLMEQGGIGVLDEDHEHHGSDISDNVDISEHVVIFNGDLSTSERLEAMMERRAIEGTPLLRFQFVVFLPGLFHLKMACADALWRLFLEKRDAHADDNSLMSFVALHRPRETNKIGSSPGFRRMHEVITQEGVALRLDAWRVEVQIKNKEWDSLESFARAKPTLTELQKIANDLPHQYMASNRSREVDVHALREQPHAQRDAQRENVLLMHLYFLLYEEITHSMNYGDIGRLETAFLPWIPIFKGTGKHKYATSMCKFLNDLHWRYPEPLRRAIRTNILVNPTGKAGAFRALDWVQELHNLKTKVCA